MSSVLPSRFLFGAVAAALLCCCVAVLAPAAGARTPLRAKFKVTLSGVDQANWSYRYPATAPRRLCVPHERVGSGTQTVRYASQSAFVVKAKSSRNGMPKLAPGALNGARFPVQATITRQSSDTGTGCSLEMPTAAPDCGTKNFNVLGNLRYLRKARLGFFTMAASLRLHVFQNCPNFFGAVGREDSLGVGLRTALAKLPQKTLFNSRKRRLVVTGTGTEHESSTSRSVAFATRWKAVFRRVH